MIVLGTVTASGLAVQHVNGKSGRLAASATPQIVSLSHGDMDGYPDAPESEPYSAYLNSDPSMRILLYKDAYRTDAEWVLPDPSGVYAYDADVLELTLHEILPLCLVNRHSDYGSGRPFDQSAFVMLNTTNRSGGPWTTNLEGSQSYGESEELVQHLICPFGGVGYRSWLGGAYDYWGCPAVVAAIPTPCLETATYSGAVDGDAIFDFAALRYSAAKLDILIPPLAHHDLLLYVDGDDNIIDVFCATFRVDRNT